MLSKRFLMVPPLSSAARIPLPLATIALATRIISLEFIVESSGIDGVRLTSARNARRAAVLIPNPLELGAPRIANQPTGRPHSRRAESRWCTGLAPPAISTKLVLVKEGTPMLRMSRLTDYATVLLAEQTRIAAPTVCKLLKQRQRAGLVTSTRGPRGGYQLARPAAQISAAAILDALEGPLALTDCSAGHGNCEIEDTCRVGRVWQRLNLAIRRSLYEVSLAQLAGLEAAPARLPALEREMKAAGARAPVRS